jgi:hypothetical protein
MERVETLLQKLQEQFDRKVAISQMLLTVQQLQAELMHVQQDTNNPAASTSVAVVMPLQHSPVQPEMQPVTEPEPTVSPVPEVKVEEKIEEKIVEVLQVDEAEIEAELEEIKRNAAAKNNMSVHTRPVILFEEMDDIPTLAHQYVPEKPRGKEINDVVAAEQPSVNDVLKQSAMELGDQLTEAPVRDLRKAIGINDQYLYINELFRGDETMYERSIKTINSFSILPEAEYWIQRELKVKLGWSDSNATVKQFSQLVKRRFS